MNKRARLAAALIPTAFTATIVYILLHESGHTLVALACGARITEFSIVSAEMSYVGGNFTNAAYALFNIAGAGFPLLIAAFALLFYHKNITKPVYHVVWFFLSVVPTAALLAWTVIPVAALFSEPPAGDDVTKFLVSSGLPPLAVAVGALVVILLMLAWAFQKGLPEAFVRVIKAAREK